MTTLTANPAPTRVDDILPAKPLDGTSRRPREAAQRGRELAEGLHTERANLKSALWTLTAELCEVISAGKSPSKVLGTISDVTARLGEIDRTLPTVTAAASRLNSIATAATKADADIAAWTQECARVRDAWHRLDTVANELYQLDQKHGIKLASAGKPYPLAEERAAWLEAEHLHLAQAVQAGATATDPVPGQHGTRGRYVHQGCRCPVCREANARFFRSRRTPPDAQRVRSFDEILRDPR